MNAPTEKEFEKEKNIFVETYNMKQYYERLVN